ncbi:selenocysteine-specific translation elongation factor [Texcoconibacillus texcoconensis]|uniref:Selenocysteine-specific elongation factor n=1 Tax=Texcoconibacillus texcoconensis TaxID=1095777 RepID=A0A840QSG5_9BACI|nr:selenocysteine-specific translation elongation factor [Texcoconibacillus texcoconensis]MBB5174452.1 selenocysteine-specific elongation factor [Texcoconibacillus texcoconensis]
MKRSYTIGMAGHIDHGKTTLTKTLTDIDTDRLKAEKERNISIELGYAPFHLSEDTQVSIVDVPGHEKFIRQMIAGVAGIDLVLLVVAADEGVMPQTVEHLDILRLLGINEGMIVVTKKDQVDEEMIELVEEDIRASIEGTFFEGTELVFVDSLTKEGIDTLKNMIEQHLTQVEPRDTRGAFRLPIDQVFTVHGQGTVVRGTVYEGTVHEGDVLEVLPSEKKVRARQLQVHHEKRTVGQAGQRVAVNLGGISNDELKRGDVLVSTQHYFTTETIDIHLDTVHQLAFPLKQRMLTKLHIGTAEVFGTLVFFDRNESAEDEGILCQLRLQEPIVTKRGDRFILRRPTPVETIGGGIVIDPKGEKYKFGEGTIKMLERKREGTPAERILDTLKIEKSATVQLLVEETGIIEDEVKELVADFIEQGVIINIGSTYLLNNVYEEIVEVMEADLLEFHENYPMRQGKNKAELIQDLLHYGNELADLAIEKAAKDGRVKKDGQYISALDFVSVYPSAWRKRMEQVENTLKEQGLNVEVWGYILENAGIPERLHEELRHFLLRKKRAIALDDKHLVSYESWLEAIEKLYEKTGDAFNLQEAKSILNVTRKYLVPLMEQLDERGLTKRIENERFWQKDPKSILK